MLIRRLLVAVLLLAGMPAVTMAQASTSTGTISGSVKTVNGAPVPGASVLTDGPTRTRVVTDASGAFSIVVAPGFYNVTVTKGGYVPATLNGLSVFSGETQPLNVTMTQADLSSLRTIASVSTSRGSSINTGAASSNYLSAEAVQNLANPQINDTLQRMPEVVIQRIGSQPDTTIVDGGVQPYETQVLIDGHPLSLGEYGVWLTEYFPSFLLGGVETQIGPGNTTPFASTAVGGTTNLLTPGYTKAPTYNLVVGSDNYESQYSNFLATGSFNKLSYVVGVGYGSNNGPYYQTTHCVMSPSNSGLENQPGNSGIIEFCGDASGSLFTKGTLLKLKYDFSSATSFEVGFLGAYGGFLPQGTGYGQFLGDATILPCYEQPNGTAAGTGPVCTNPANANLVGKTIPTYGWYPGSNVYYNQPIFTGQLRTSVGNDTLLVRPYAGNIAQVLDGAGEDNFPLNFSPVGSCTVLTSTACQTYINDTCPFYFTGQPYGPNGQTTVTKSGQLECYQTQFSELEQDKLYGNTLSYLHPFGDNLLTFTWDFHGDNSYGYYNANTPADVTVPNTLERYTTLSLVGDIRASRTLAVKAGVYESLWSVAGSQSPTAYATPGPDGLVPQVGLQRSVAHFDPHVALTYQPTNKISYRAAFGSSVTFPFAGYLSGAPFYTPASITSGTVAPNGFVTFKAPYLNPETASEFSLGMDARLARYGIFKIDLQSTQVHNVFEELTTPTAVPWSEYGTVIPGVSVVQPTNAALLNVKIATLQYNFAPPTGFGYNASLAFEKSQVSGIPNVFYAYGPSLPANGQQTCGFGEATPGSVTCIPYMKGYFQLNYTLKDGTYAGLGADFEGKNNTYFQPPFLIMDFTIRRPVTKTLEAQLSVENLLNTNNFWNLPMPNAGTTTTTGSYGAYYCGTTTYCQTTSPSTLVPAPPRTFRFQLRYHYGKP
jgi:hypothetical protein